MPIYIAVNSAYKDKQGETQFYDLSTITEVKVNDDMFDIDASHLAENGYIKLTPNTEAENTKNMLEDVEDFGALQWSTGIEITLTNNRGERLVSKLQITYLPKNEQKDVLTIKKSDLDEEREGTSACHPRCTPEDTGEEQCQSRYPRQIHRILYLQLQHLSYNRQRQTVGRW